MEYKIDINKLKYLCNKFTVEVSFYGISPFFHKVIDANLLLEEIHQISLLSKEDFVLNINKGNFMGSMEIESIFKNIKSPGHFLISGHESLGNHSFIEKKSLNWLDDVVS